MQRMRFDKDFDLPPDQVFSFFAEHENLGGVLGAEVTRLSDGTDGHRNGVGSSRRLKPPGPVPAFEETVTEFVPDEKIVYKITKGTPLNHHLGTVTFAPTESGTHMEWNIEIGAAFPGLDFIISKVLIRNIGGGLDRMSIPA
ncbi:MAG: SRPBCC family protein [Solirubrobacterales bacterium]|nr:SRPBCC family protein [Solirubrobacterales bacterium]MCB0859687.1 SRPBCC family protein [Solirubrobacterales bacterium]HRV60653.1 SRPBCC family protein [Solirubrobacterales bacterium]